MSLARCTLCLPILLNLSLNLRHLTLRISSCCHFYLFYYYFCLFCNGSGSCSALRGGYFFTGSRVIFADSWGVATCKPCRYWHSAVCLSFVCLSSTIVDYVQTAIDRVMISPQATAGYNPHTVNVGGGGGGGGRVMMIWLQDGVFWPYLNT